MESGTVHELTAAYALDALDASEQREFEEHLRTCASCREELASFQTAAASLGFAVESPQPPPALRGRILERVHAERGVVVPLRRPRFVLGAVSGLAAAAAVAAIGLGIWATSLSNDLDRTRAALAIVGDPSARSIDLSGATGRLVVAPEGRAALVVRSLAAAPAGRTYEVWVIEGNRPRPAGLFEGGEQRNVVLLDRNVPADAVVAVTVEQDGGVEAPTGKPLFTAQT
jgi:anti-sigma-K factor RskA